MVRGGFGGAPGGYTLSVQRAAAGPPSREDLPFWGVEAELLSFARAVRAGVGEAAQAIAAEGTVAKGTAAKGTGEASGEGEGGGTALEEGGSTGLGEDLYRISAAEAVRDLALVEALLASSDAGGGAVPVQQVG